MGVVLVLGVFLGGFGGVGRGGGALGKLGFLVLYVVGLCYYVVG